MLPRMGVTLLCLLVIVVQAVPARSGGETAVEDWTRFTQDLEGAPDGWEFQTMGLRVGRDAAVTTFAGRRAVRLRSRDVRVTIARDLEGKVRLGETPVLRWQWAVAVLPPGGDARQKATSDHAAQVFVAWHRPPSFLRSRIIGYVWDTSAPAGAVIPSRKTGLVTFVIVRSGTSGLGQWWTEQRDVRADYLRVYGEAAPDPSAISLSTDSDDTHSTTEVYFGPLSFVPADAAPR